MDLKEIRIYTTEHFANRGNMKDPPAAVSTTGSSPPPLPPLSSRTDPAPTITIHARPTPKLDPPSIVAPNTLTAQPASRGFTIHPTSQFSSGGDVLRLTLSYLDLSELLEFMTVSKSWHTEIMRSRAWEQQVFTYPYAVLMSHATRYYYQTRTPEFISRYLIESAPPLRFRGGLDHAAAHTTRSACVDRNELFQYCCNVWTTEILPLTPQQVLGHPQLHGNGVLTTEDEHAAKRFPGYYARPEPSLIQQLRTRLLLIRVTERFLSPAALNANRYCHSANHPPIVVLPNMLRRIAGYNYYHIALQKFAEHHHIPPRFWNPYDVEPLRPVMRHIYQYTKSLDDALRVGPKSALGMTTGTHSRICHSTGLVCCGVGSGGRDRPSPLPDTIGDGTDEGRFGPGYLPLHIELMAIISELESAVDPTTDQNESNAVLYTPHFQNARIWSNDSLRRSEFAITHLSIDVQNPANANPLARKKWLLDWDREAIQRSRLMRDVCVTHAKPRSKRFGLAVV